MCRRAGLIGTLSRWPWGSGRDPSAVAYVIDPTLFETETARVRVDTDGLGQTITAFDPVPDF